MKIKFYWNVLSKSEKIHFLFILTLGFLQSFLDLIGITLILPFLSFLLGKNFLDDFNINSFFKTKLEFIFNLDVTIFIFVFFLVFLGKNIILLIINFFTQLFIFKLRSRIFYLILNKLIHQEFIFFLKNDFSKISNLLISEVSALVVNFFRPIIYLLIELFILFLILILILSTANLKFLSALVMGIFLIFLIFTFFNKRIKKLSRERIENNYNINSLLFQFISGIKEIFISGKITQVLGNFEKQLFKYTNIDHKINTFLNIPKSILEIIAVLIFCLSVFIMINTSVSNEIILANIGLYVAIAYRLLPSFNKITINIQQLRYGGSSIKIVKEFLDLNFHRTFISNHVQFNDQIEFRNLNFSYDNEVIVKNVDIKFKKGNIVGITGPSGSGKSTILGLFSLLLSSDKSMLFVDGKKIENKEDIRGYQNLIFLTSSESFLINDTIKKNILFGKKFEESLFKKVIKQAKLEEIYGFENGIDTVINLNNKNLSTGQKQRISIARSLYNTREIMIYDEATNAIDKIAEKEIINNICNSENKKTTILVSHDENNLRYCDEVYKVENGNVIKIKP